MDKVRCLCKKEASLFTVKKEGVNKNREFYKCELNVCDFFAWNDSKNYDTNKFKKGSCFRCGRYGCDGTDCDEKFDWFGNRIPSDD